MRLKRIIAIAIVAAGLNVLAATVVSSHSAVTPSQTQAQTVGAEPGSSEPAATPAPADTTKQKKAKYSVRKTDRQSTKDLDTKTADLQDPDNLQTEVSYDEKDNTYTIGTALVSGKDASGKKTSSSATTSTVGGGSVSFEPFSAAARAPDETSV